MVRNDGHQSQLSSSVLSDATQHFFAIFRSQKATTYRGIPSAHRQLYEDQLVSPKSTDMMSVSEGWKHFHFGARKYQHEVAGMKKLSSMKGLGEKRLDF